MVEFEEGSTSGARSFDICQLKQEGAGGNGGNHEYGSWKGKGERVTDYQVAVGSKHEAGKANI